MRCVHDLLEPGLDPGLRARVVAVGEHRLQHRHRVEALAVAHRLDVGVGVGVEARGDRDAVGVVGRVVLGGDGAEDRLGVGARQVAEPPGQPGQVALVLHPVQQLLGAERRGRHHDVLGGEDLLAAGRLGLREPHADVVPALVARARRDPGDRGERQDRGAVLLGEVEVVLDQRVLGVVAAAAHALAAVEARTPRRARSAEERVRDLLARRLAGPAEEDADRGGVEGVADAHVAGDLLHDVVRGRADRVLDDAEHPLGLVVVGRELGLPVGDVAPLRVVVERRQRLVERVRVDQRPAADARAGHDHRVADRVDPLDAVHPERRRPQEVLDVRRALGEVVVLEPPAGLEHADPVALLGQPQRGDRAAEAGADDQDVEVEASAAAVARSSS